MKKLIGTILLGLGLLQARDVNLAWDYEEATYQGLAGFEFSAARNQGDLFTENAITTSVTVDGSDDNVVITAGYAQGFASAVSLPAGVWYLACRAYIIDAGTQVNGEASNTIRVMVTPGKVILRMV